MKRFNLFASDSRDMAKADFPYDCNISQYNIIDIYYYCPAMLSNPVEDRHVDVAVKLES